MSWFEAEIDSDQARCLGRRAVHAIAQCHGPGPRAGHTSRGSSTAGSDPYSARLCASNLVWSRCWMRLRWWSSRGVRSSFERPISARPSAAQYQARRHLARERGTSSAARSPTGATGPTLPPTRCPSGTKRLSKVTREVPAFRCGVRARLPRPQQLAEPIRRRCARALRSPGTRGRAVPGRSRGETQLKNWRILREIRSSPCRAGELVAAVQTLMIAST